MSLEQIIVAIVTALVAAAGAFGTGIGLAWMLMRYVFSDWTEWRERMEEKLDTLLKTELRTDSLERQVTDHEGRIRRLEQKEG